MLNSGVIKLSTCQSLTSKLRDCVDAGPRGIPHVARFIQQRIEHQRDRQKNRTQPWNGEETPSLSSPPLHPKKDQRSPANWMAIEKSNGGGAPRCKQAGHARRRRMKAELYRSDPFPSWTRMPFIPDASIGVLP